MSPQEHLYRFARDARQTAYAPYSGFAVGAAILSASGNYYSGSNVENISYPCGSCAEQSAISAMVAGGDREIAQIMILADTKQPISPCGACLQRIKEFSQAQTIVHLADLSGLRESHQLSELLPIAFNASELQND